MTFNAKHLKVVIVVAAALKQWHDVIHLCAWCDKPFRIAHLAKRLILHDPMTNALERSTSDALCGCNLVHAVHVTRLPTIRPCIVLPGPLMWQFLK